MARNWPYMRVEDIAEKVAMGPFGSSIKVETFTPTGIPIISGQHLHEAELKDGDNNFISTEHADALKNANVRRGDVIFTHAGNIGQVAFIPEDSVYDRYVISQRQFYLRCNTKLILPEFVTYYFKSPEGRHRLLANATQVGVPSIARPSSYLKSIEVPVPPLDLQRVVVSCIRALDAKIRVNRRINQTLEAMAQAIFKSWFVDFDPVKAKIAAKAEGRDPLRAAMTAISGKPDAELDTLPPDQFATLAATAALFPEEMEGSELGEIPKGWNVARVRDVVEGVYDGPHATPPEAAHGPVFLGIRNLTGTGLDLGDIRHIAEADWEQWTRRVTPRAGDMVFSYEATLGYFALLPPGLRCCLGRRLALIRPLADHQDCGAFWFHQFVAHPFQRFLAKHTIPGATVNRIALKDFPSFPVLNPPLALQRAFVSSANCMWASIHALQAESQQLAALRDTLLPKLLSGELQVHNAEAEAVT